MATRSRTNDRAAVLAPGQGPRSYLTVADDIQRLPLNKIMAIGLYPDRVVLMHRPADAQGQGAMANLALMLAISGLPAGEYETRSTLVTPDGKEHLNTETAKVTSPGGSAAVNLHYVFKPFPVPMPGRFVLRAELGGMRFEEDFTILMQDLTQALAQMTGITSPPTGEYQTAAVQPRLGTKKAPVAGKKATAKKSKLRGIKPLPGALASLKGKN